MKFSKARIPKIAMRGKRPIFSYIVASIILIGAIFLISASCSSTSFHETMENIANSLPGDKRENVASTVSSVTAKVNDKKSSTTESFVSNVSYRDTPTPFPGSVINPAAWSPPLDIAGKDSASLKLNNLDIFKSAHFSPSCCAKGPGSGLSTSMGCVCLTNKDAYFITEGRGGNNMNPSAII